jgi:hypothetical protein
MGHQISGGMKRMVRGNNRNEGIVTRVVVVVVHVAAAR